MSHGSMVRQAHHRQGSRCPGLLTSSQSRMLPPPLRGGGKGAGDHVATLSPTLPPQGGGKKLVAGMTMGGILLSLLFSLACQRAPEIDKLTQQQIDELKKSAGELEVVFHAPTEEAKQPRNIVVSFNQPMVPLTAIGERNSPKIFTIKPEVPGWYRWLGAKTVAFYPEDHFPFSTDFQVVVPGATKSLLDKTLGQDFVWNFSTPPPQVIQIYPKENEERVKRDVRISLTFNQPVDPAVVQKETQILAGDKKVSFRARHPTDEEIKNSGNEKETKIMLVPVSLLPLESKIEVAISEKLKGREGSREMGVPYSSSFTVHGPFTVGALDCTQKCNPRSSLKLATSNAIPSEEFVKKVKFEPLVKTDLYAYRDSYEKTMNFSSPLKANTAYTLILPADLTDEFGQKLGREVKINFSTASFEPELDFRNGFGVLESEGEKKYYARILNIRNLNFKTKILSAEQVVGWLSSGKIWSTREDPFGEGEEDRSWNTPYKPLDAYESIPIPLVESVSEGSGFVLLDVSSPQITFEDGNHVRLNHHKALLQVTNLGLTAKWGVEKTLIWTTNLSDGKTASDVSVEIRDSRGAVLWSAVTNEEGLATAPGTEELESRRSGDQEKDKEGDEEYSWASNRNSYFLFAKKDRDRAFAVNDWNEGFSPWEFGISQAWNPAKEQWRLYLFTERGVYQPGDTVHVKGIVRQETEGELAIPAGEANLVGINGRGEEFFTQKISLSDNGTFHTDIPLSSSANLGYYRLVLRPVEQEVKVDGGAHFMVEFYRTPEFKVGVKIAEQTYLQGDNLKAEIRGDYLFGAPMKGKKVEWSFSRETDYYTPEAQGDDGFDWGRSWEERTTTEVGTDSEAVEKNGVLNDEGVLTVLHPLVAPHWMDPALYILEGTITDVSNQSYASQDSVIVHPADIYVGLKASSTFEETGKPINVAVRTADIPGKKLTEISVEAVWYRIEWHTVKKEGFGGAYNYESERVEKEVHRCGVKTTDGADPVCSFTPTEAGLYRVKASAKDSKNRSVASSTDIYVYGEGYGGWKWEDSDRLTLVPDKKVYHPGDVAKVMIQSPFPKAQALITYERGSAYFKKVVELTGSSPTIEVPIARENVPNFYFSVVMVSGRSVTAQDGKGDPGKPAVKVGMISLPVETDEYDLEVQVKSDREIYRPGDEVKLDLAVNGSDKKGVEGAEVAVMVVDLGVLMLTSHPTPDPLSTFYSWYGLGVTTTDSRIHLVGQRAYGAKMAEEAAGGGEAPQWRAKFVPSAYWNPTVMTDEKGEAKVSFTLPDNLTTFKIMAVAVAGAPRFGSGENEFKTKKDLMLSPALPRFLRVGDRTTAGVVAHNQSAEKMEVEIRATVEGAILKGDDVKKVSLSPGGSLRVAFDYEVPEGDKAVFSFEGKGGEWTDNVRLEVPVQYPLEMETVASQGATETMAQEKMVKPKDVFEKIGGLSVSLSSTLLSALKGEFHHLLNYPYGCLEQRVSSVYPAVVFSDMMKNFGFNDEEYEKYKKRVIKVIGEAVDEQDYYGGFKYWRDSWEVNPYLSAYVMGFLIDAKQYGYAVPEKTLTKGFEYLRQLLLTKSQGQKEVIPATKIEILSTMKKGGEEVSIDFDSFFALQDKLDLKTEALLIRLLHAELPDDSRVAEWIKKTENRVVMTSSGAHFLEGKRDIYSMGSDRMTTAILLSTLIRVSPNHSLVVPLASWLSETTREKAHLNTHESVEVLMALHDYFDLKESAPPNFTAAVQTAKTNLIESRFEGHSLRVDEKMVPMGDLPPEMDLVVKKEGSGKLFYRSVLSYAKKGESGFPIEEGIVVGRTFMTLDGKPAPNPLKPAETYKVQLTAVFLEDSPFVVVKDSLPAGLEPVNLRLSGSPYDKLNRSKNEGISSSWTLAELATHVEMHNSHVLVFADFVPAGVYEYAYFVRATVPGSYILPPSTAAQMYHPETFGRTVSTVVTVH